MKDALGHGSNQRGEAKLTPVQAENAPFKSRLGRAAGHSYLDPNDPRANKGVHAAKVDNLPAKRAKGSLIPRVVKDTSVKGSTHALVRPDGKVLGRLYKRGSPAWR